LLDVTLLLLLLLRVVLLPILLLLLAVAGAGALLDALFLIMTRVCKHRVLNPAPNPQNPDSTRASFNSGPNPQPNYSVPCPITTSFLQLHNAIT
jgi:hypothetical protein